MPMLSPSIQRNTAVRYAGEMGHFPVPGGEIIEAELIDVPMSTGTGHDLDEFGGGSKEVV